MRTAQARRRRFDGIAINANISTAGGDVLINGKGGTSFQNDGVFINATVESDGAGAGAGLITINGDGSANEGVGVRHHGQVTSNDGNILITAEGDLEHGLLLSGDITSTGTGTDDAAITIVASTLGGSSKTGIFMLGDVTSVEGPINVTANGNGLAGILMNSSSKFASTGTTTEAATITINATSTFRHGFLMQQNSVVESVIGNRDDHRHRRDAGRWDPHEWIGDQSDPLNGATGRMPPRSL